MISNLVIMSVLEKHLGSSIVLASAVSLQWVPSDAQSADKNAGRWTFWTISSWRTLLRCPAARWRKPARSVITCTCTVHFKIPIVLRWPVQIFNSLSFVFFSSLIGVYELWRQYRGNGLLCGVCGVSVCDMHRGTSKGQVHQRSHHTPEGGDVFR